MYAPAPRGEVEPLFSDGTRRRGIRRHRGIHHLHIHVPPTHRDTHTLTDRKPVPDAHRPDGRNTRRGNTDGRSCDTRGPLR